MKIRAAAAALLRHKKLRRQPHQWEFHHRVFYQCRWCPAFRQFLWVLWCQWVSCSSHWLFQ